MRYDIERIHEDLSVVEVFNYYGINCRENRERYDILCPNPEHYDRHFGNCFMQKSGHYCCFGCGDSGSIFDYFMKKFQCNFPVAVGTVAEALGGKQFYSVPDVGADYFFDEKGYMELPLKKEELDFLGLSRKSTVELPYNYSFEKPDEGKKYQVEYGKEIEEGMEPVDQKGYILLRALRQTFPLKILFNEEPDVYDALIRGKAKEKMIEVLSGSWNEEEFQKLKQLYLLHGGCLEEHKESPFCNLSVTPM